MSDKDEQVASAVAAGSAFLFEDWDGERVAEEIALDGTVGRLLSGLREIVLAHRGAIAARFPKATVSRRNSGYALDYLAETVLVKPEGAPVNLAKFLCGSEGTLAIINEN